VCSKDQFSQEWVKCLTRPEMMQHMCRTKASKLRLTEHALLHICIMFAALLTNCRMSHSHCSLNLQVRPVIKSGKIQRRNLYSSQLYTTFNGISSSEESWWTCIELQSAELLCPNKVEVHRCPPLYTSMLSCWP